MPGQPEQDRGGSVRAPASGAGRSAAGVAIATVFIISGPSGAGKGTVIRRLLDMVPDLEPTVSATTRSARPDEEDGREYHFLSPEEFRRRVTDDRFLEWVDYGGNLYGTLRSEIDDRLARGVDVILEIELQGARAVRSLLPDAIAIFIAPPSLAELARRLRGRGTETDESIARRLAIAEQEVAAAREFDVVIVNDEADRAARAVAEVVARQRSGVADVPPA